MIRLTSLLLVLSSLLLLAGCATTPTEPHEEDVSSLPWNRPQRWEGQGMLGGMGGQ